MPLEYVSIGLGVVAVVLGFTPYLPVQVLGVCAGIAGIVVSRRAVKRDYRRDLPSTVGMVASIAGIVVSGITPLATAVILVLQTVLS